MFMLLAKQNVTGAVCVLHFRCSLDSKELPIFKCLAEIGKRNFSGRCTLSTRLLRSKCHRFTVLVCIRSIVYR